MGAWRPCTSFVASMANTAAGSALPERIRAPSGARSGLRGAPCLAHLARQYPQQLPRGVRRQRVQLSHQRALTHACGFSNDDILGATSFQCKGGFTGARGLACWSHAESSLAHAKCGRGWGFKPQMGRTGRTWVAQHDRDGARPPRAPQRLVQAAPVVLPRHQHRIRISRLLCGRPRLFSAMAAAMFGRCRWVPLHGLRVC